MLECSSVTEVVIDDVFIRTDGRGIQKSAVADWTLRFWILFAAMVILRVGYLLTFSCNLVGDEAYYWDWGRRLSWGYFSKPPFIAWMMGLAGYTGGNTAFGLRLYAALLNCGSMLFAFLLARRMYGAKVGFWSAALFAAMPGAALLGLLLTIDAPLVFFWSAALFCFYGMINPRNATSKVTCAVGLLLVLGLGHLSKQIMWCFPPLGVIYLICDGTEGRKKLASPLLWLVFGLSYLFLLPTIIWNAHHGWITFVHTGHHFQGDGFLSFPKNFGEFVGMQLGAVSPVIGILLLGLCIGGIFSWRKMASRERFLVIFSGVPLFVMTLMTLRQGLNGNWAAAFYPAGLILVAGWALNKDVQYPRLPERMRGWLQPGLWVAVCMAVLVYSLPFLVNALGLEGSKKDPFARLRGWDEYAKAVQKTRETLPRVDAPILVVGHRYYASELAFYLPDQPQVYHWTTPGKIDSQYEIWGGLEILKGHNVFIVSAEKGGVLPEDLRACLAGSSPRGVVAVDIGNGRKIQVSLYWSEFLGMPNVPNASENAQESGE